MTWKATEFRRLDKLRQAAHDSMAPRVSYLRRGLVLLEGQDSVLGSPKQCEGNLNVTVVGQTITVCGGVLPIRVIVGGVLVGTITECCGSFVVTGPPGGGGNDVLVEVVDNSGGGGGGVVSPPQVATPVISPAGGTLYPPGSVSISCSTPGATIYYTVDGSTPTRSSASGTALTLDPTLHDTVKAIAVLPWGLDSGVAVQTFLAPRVATPSISPTGGTLYPPGTVTITCATPGATIHYTVDGSTPTRASASGGSLTLDPTVHNTVKAFAVASGYLDSVVSVETFTAPKVATPTFSPTDAAVGSTDAVSISCTPGVTIYYTLDGAEPTRSSPIYSGPFTLGAYLGGSVTIKAYAIAPGYVDSNTGVKSYDVLSAFNLPMTVLLDGNAPPWPPKLDYPNPIWRGFYGWSADSDDGVLVSHLPNINVAGWNISGDVTSAVINDMPIGRTLFIKNTYPRDATSDNLGIINEFEYLAYRDYPWVAYPGPPWLGRTVAMVAGTIYDKTLAYTEIYSSAISRPTSDLAPNGQWGLDLSIYQTKKRLAITRVTTSLFKVRILNYGDPL